MMDEAPADLRELVRLPVIFPLTYTFVSLLSCGGGFFFALLQLIRVICAR
jgi:hypothetical protein